MSGLSPLKRMDTIKNPKTGEHYPIPEDQMVLRNNRYTVYVESASSYSNAFHRFEEFDILHLSIKRNDRKPIDSWADMQWIKNRIAGEESEAVQLYPAESRLLDAANQYHLWVIGGQWPVGFRFEPGEKTTATPEEAAEFGASQNRRQK